MNPTLEDRFYALISQLTERTSAGSISWQVVAGPPEPQTFETRLPSQNRVTITSLKSGGYPYLFTLFGSDGAKVEEIRTLGPTERVGPWDELLRLLYQAARANALDIDGVVNRALGALGVDPSSVPPRPPSDEDIPF